SHGGYIAPAPYHRPVPAPRPVSACSRNAPDSSRPASAASAPERSARRTSVGFLGAGSHPARPASARPASARPESARAGMLGAPPASAPLAPELHQSLQQGYAPELHQLVETAAFRWAERHGHTCPDLAQESSGLQVSVSESSWERSGNAGPDGAGSKRETVPGVSHPADVDKLCESVPASERTHTQQQQQQHAVLIREDCPQGGRCSFRERLRGKRVLDGGGLWNEHRADKAKELSLGEVGASALVDRSRPHLVDVLYRRSASPSTSTPRGVIREVMGPAGAGMTSEDVARRIAQKYARERHIAQRRQAADILSELHNRSLHAHLQQKDLSADSRFTSRRDTGQEESEVEEDASPSSGV
ncbi:unnamed protein product, partial [Polarella glacialis]